MIIRKADFLMSNSRVDKLPKGVMPEYAFIGRSNVGKSSLINMLVQKKGLAKTSATPGKTISINHFVINDEWYIVDLPGYGYAKRSKAQREEWQKTLNRYLKTRQNLIITFVLVDSRIEPQKNDIEFMQYLGENQIPFAVVFTKIDKLSATKAESNIQRYRDFLLQEWEELPPIFVTSSENGTGRDEILNFVENLNQEYQEFIKM